jgi:hypothetical protein
MVRSVIIESWIRSCGEAGRVFHNREDNAYEFEDALRRNFKKVETWVVGAIFIWRAEGPKLDE